MATLNGLTPNEQTIDCRTEEPMAVPPGSGGDSCNHPQIVIGMLVVILRRDAVAGFTGGAGAQQIVIEIALPVGSGVGSVRCATAAACLYLLINALSMIGFQTSVLPFC